MDTFLQGVEQILDRFRGPLNFRLVVMPAVVTFLAIRAGLRDARERNPVRVWTFLTKPAERPRLFRGGLKDVGKVFIMAVVLDTTYQLIVFRWVYPVQVLFVAVACAIVPYVVVRDSVAWLARRLRKSTPVEHPGT